MPKNRDPLRVLMAFVAALAAGCGDDKGTQPDAGALVDAGP